MWTVVHGSLEIYGSRLNDGWQLTGNASAAQATVSRRSLFLVTPEREDLLKSGSVSTESSRRGFYFIHASYKGAYGGDGYF